MFDATFLGDIKAPFNPSRFSMERRPIESFAYTPAKPHRPWASKNHWMIKCKSQDYIIMDELEPDVRRFCQKAIDFMRAFRLHFEDRYLYLTVDDREISKGNTQRQPGWHFDGMQGSEVPSPTPGCFQFLWCDHSPMQFAAQPFQVKGLNRHEVNFFDSLGNQVEEDKVETAKARMTYLMSPYQLHQGSPVDRSGRRKLLRLSASHQPITSIRMTVNPYMDYDYPYHTTTGEIPEKLKVLYNRALQRKAA